VIITDKDAELAHISKRMSTSIRIDKFPSNVSESISEEWSITWVMGFTEHFHVYFGKWFHCISLEDSQLTKFLIEKDLQLGLVECFENLNICLIIDLDHDILGLQNIWELNIRELPGGRPINLEEWLDIG